MKKAVYAMLVSTMIGGSATAGNVIQVALIGDSTVTDSAGWGQAFAARFDTGVKVRNFAVGGRSSKSWYNEKRLPTVLAARPDYALIRKFCRPQHTTQPGKRP
jgi:pectinesterase